MRSVAGFVVGMVYGEWGFFVEREVDGREDGRTGGKLVYAKKKLCKVFLLY